MKAAIVLALAVATLLPARAHAKGCHEISHVVGYEKCTRFGMWSRDLDWFPLRLEVGWLHESFPTKPFTLSGTDARTTAMPSEGEPTTVADGASVRWLGGTRLLYGGLEMDSAGLVRQPEFTGLPAGDGTMFAGLAVIGVHASLWRFAAGLELAAGGRVTSYDYCGGDEKSCNQSETQGAGVVEARVRVEWFPTQRWSFGAAYGRSLIDDERSFYVFTGIHLRALDGMY